MRASLAVFAASMFLLGGCSDASKVSGPVMSRAPTGVSMEAGPHSVTVRWDDSSDALAYNVYLAPEPGFRAAGGIKRRVTRSPFTLSGLLHEDTWFAVVTAIGAMGEGPASEEVSAIPTTGATAPVTGDAVLVPVRLLELRGKFNVRDGFKTNAFFEITWEGETGMATFGNLPATVDGRVFARLSLDNEPKGRTLHYRLGTQNSDGVFYGSTRSFRTPE